MDNDDATFENDEAMEQVAEEKPTGPSEDDIAKLLAEAEERGRNSGYAKARRELKSKRTRRTAAPKPEPAQEAEPDIYSTGDWRDEFYDAIDERPHLSSKRKALRKRVMAEKPDSIGEWMDDFADTFGLAPAGETETQTNNTQTDPAKRPVSDRGAPSGPSGMELGERVDKLSAREIAKMEEKHGIVGAGNILKERWQKQAKKMSYYVGRKRS